MKACIWFMAQEAGTIESSEDGTVSVGGPRHPALASLVRHYHRTTKLDGDRLVRYVADRLRGYWTADLEEDEDAITSPRPEHV